ncbi:hypothetical protein D3C85_1270090 [compost metagenome]
MAGQRQFDGLSGAGWEIRDIRDVVAAQQNYQFRVAVHRRLQNVDLFVPGKMVNTFGDVASLNGLKGLQDFLVIMTEL